MVLAMVVCANAGDLMLKRGMSQIGAVRLTPSGLAQAFLFLHESVSPRRWFGVVLICVGVLLVGQTKPRTTAVAGEAAT